MKGRTDAERKKLTKEEGPVEKENEKIFKESSKPKTTERTDFMKERLTSPKHDLTREDFLFEE